MAKGPRIKACLFDMDGLLINTEDMYTEATNRMLAEYGKGPLPWSVKIELQGRPGPEAAQLLLDWSKVPLTTEELFAKTSKFQEKLWTQTKFLPGALELLKKLHVEGVPIALATSTTYQKYQMKTNHLRYGFDLFRHHVVTGDDERIPAGKGKPAPDIWLIALESLNAERRAQGLEEILPEETMVLEDGIPGVIGAQAAGCFVTWVPHPEAAELLGQKKIDEIISRAPGEYLKTLEDFDGRSYGLYD